MNEYLKTWKDRYTGELYFHIFDSVPELVNNLADKHDEKYYELKEVRSDFFIKERERIWEENEAKKAEELKASELAKMIRLMEKYPDEAESHFQLDV